MITIKEIEQRLLQVFDKPCLPPVRYGEYSDPNEFYQDNYLKEVDVIFHLIDRKDLEGVYKLACNLAMEQLKLKSNGKRYTTSEIDQQNNFLKSLESLYEITAFPEKYDLPFLTSNSNEVIKELAHTPDTGRLKQFEPIRWQKSSVLLAYLINQLKTYGFIDDTNIWATCEQIFLDRKGGTIKASTFTSMIKNYERNKTQYGNTERGKPKGHTEISQLVAQLRDISRELES